jgi:hypothetical protein
MAPKDREERTSGLLAAISHFAFGEHAKLFNPEKEAITIDAALKNSQIVYFQLPVLLSSIFRKSYGKTGFAIASSGSGESSIDLLVVKKRNSLAYSWMTSQNTFMKASSPS